jgi:hypothetical protein
MLKAVLFLDFARDPGPLGFGLIVRTSSGLPSALESRLTSDGLDCRPGECTGRPTMQCMSCKSVRYCSPACQVIGWKRGHKHRCFEPNYEVSSNDILFLK